MLQKRLRTDFNRKNLVRKVKDNDEKVQKKTSLTLHVATD